MRPGILQDFLLQQRRESSPRFEKSRIPDGSCSYHKYDIMANETHGNLATSNNRRQDLVLRNLLVQQVFDFRSSPGLLEDIFTATLMALTAC